MTIYLDIVLIENLCMNYIILFAVGFIVKTKIKHFMLILSSVLGAIYAILSYIQIFSIYSNMLLKILVSVCMIYVAFFPKNIKAILKYLIVFYLVSFVFGGCAFALLYFLKPQDVFMLNGVYIGTYPVKVVLLGGIIGFVVMYLAFKIVKNNISKKSIIYEIEIKINNKTAKVRAMLDTGNRLKEPITGFPVTIVEKKCLYQILPETILNNTEKIIGGEWNECDENIEYRSRFRVIPFNSIGKQNGMLLGFKVDEVSIITDMDKITNKNVIVCIYDNILSKTNKYNALIGLDMLDKE